MTERSSHSSWMDIPSQQALVFPNINSVKPEFTTQNCKIPKKTSHHKVEVGKIN